MLGVEGKNGGHFPRPRGRKGQCHGELWGREGGGNGDSLGGLHSLLRANPLGGEVECSTHLGHPSPGFLAWSCPWLTPSWSLRDPSGLLYHLSSGIKTP